jgi:hypothetical protein
MTQWLITFLAVAVAMLLCNLQAPCQGGLRPSVRSAPCEASHPEGAGDPAGSGNAEGTVPGALLLVFLLLSLV